MIQIKKVKSEIKLTLFLLIINVCNISAQTQLENNAEDICNKVVECITNLPDTINERNFEICLTLLENEILSLKVEDRSEVEKMLNKNCNERLMTVLSTKSKRHKTNSKKEKPTDQPKSKSEFILFNVFPTRMNICYEGFPNNLDIITYGIDNMAVRSSKGNLTKGKFGYLLNCSEIGMLDIQVYSNEKRIRSSSIRIKKLPEPTFWLFKKESYKLNTSKLDSTYKLEGHLLDFDYFVQPIITSFSIRTIGKGSNESIIINQGAVLNSKTLNFLRSCQNEDIILIEDINYNYVYFPNSPKEIIIKKGIPQHLIYKIENE